MCAAVKYVPGDVVWVKVPRYPWWPAEVVAQKDCKIPDNGKKDPVAYITFPCEDAYDIIRSESNIMPFNSENKKAFIKKGENLPTDLKERFLLALKTSRKTLKKSESSEKPKSQRTSSTNCDSTFAGLTSNSESPLSTRHFPSCEPNFLQDSPSAMNTTEVSPNLSSNTSSGIVTNKISDRLRYMCGQCDFSTSRLNLMLIHYKPEINVLRCPNLSETMISNADSRKRRLAENDAYLRSQRKKSSFLVCSPPEPVGRVPCYARIPASPPVQKSSVVSPQRDKGSCYMFHDEPVKQPTHRPSFSYRSLQKNKVDMQTSKRTISTSVSTPKKYTKLKPSKEQRNGILSPKKSDKKKEHLLSPQHRVLPQKQQQQLRVSPQKQQQLHESSQKKQQESLQKQQRELLHKQQRESPLENEKLLKDSALTTSASEERVKTVLPPEKLDGKSKNVAGSDGNLKDDVSAINKSDANQEKPINSDVGAANKLADSEESSCSTDDEVVDGLSAMKSDLPVVENDIVWVKFNKYPFWPALITKVFTKKHHIYRLSVRFFGEILAKETLDYGMSYSKETIISFNDPQKEEFIKQGQESDWNEKFEDALEKVNDYIAKKDDGDLTPISDEQYICKSNSSSPEPTDGDKNDAENTTNESSWFPVQNVNIVEENQTVDMMSSDLVVPTEDICQTVLELENSESSKDFAAATVSVMPEIWIPSVDETIGSEVVLHDIDQDVLVPRDTA